MRGDLRHLPGPDNHIGHPVAQQLDIDQHSGAEGVGLAGVLEPGELDPCRNRDRTGDGFRVLFEMVGIVDGRAGFAAKSD
jgi:hypothetical protein